MPTSKPFGVRDLGQNLFSARKAAGLTLEQVGERCGIARQQVWRYEEGQRTPSALALRKLALALGVSADSLLRN